MCQRRSSEFGRSGRVSRPLVARNGADAVSAGPTALERTMELG
jgi:hypothetical protein